MSGFCNCNNDEAKECIACNKVTPCCNNKHKVRTPSEILSKVVTKMVKRENVGLNKYGKTMDRTDLHLIEWMNHLQEELMDATLYLQKMINEHTKL